MMIFAVTENEKMNKCRTCRWYIPVRQPTEEEADRIDQGEWIEMRRCLAIWANKCVYEPYHKKENKEDD